MKNSWKIFSNKKDLLNRKNQKGETIWDIQWKLKIKNKTEWIDIKNSMNKSKHYTIKFLFLLMSLQRWIRRVISPFSFNQRTREEKGREERNKHIIAAIIDKHIVKEYHHLQNPKKKKKSAWLRDWKGRSFNINL